MKDRGHVVAAVGLRHGKHLLGIRALLGAGYQVAAFDLGTLDEDPLEKEQQAQIDQMRARWPDQLILIDQLGDERIADALARGVEGAEGVLAATDEQLGATHVVYLGQWWGVVDYGVGADFILSLAARGGGELIATEADAATADHVLRWIAHWSAQPSARQVSCSTMREPLSDADSGTHGRVRAGADAWSVLATAGWTGPLSLGAADRVAKERLAAGSDLMAGRRWRYIGTGDVDSGRCAIGDSDALATAIRANEIRDNIDSDGELIEAGDTVIELRTENGDAVPYVYTEPDPPSSARTFVVLRLPGGDWPYGIEATPPEGSIEAVRLALDAGAFDFPEPFVEVTRIEVASGRLVVSDPVYLRDGQGDELDVSPGVWIVERLTHEGDLEGLRLRRDA